MPVPSMRPKLVKRYCMLLYPIACLTAASFALPTSSCRLAMSSSASSTVRVGPALSLAFALQHWATQGCPLSPLLYAILKDSALHGMQSLTHPDPLRVGLPTPQQKLLWHQAHADSLAGAAVTRPGVKQFIQAARTRSLCWP